MTKFFISWNRYDFFWLLVLFGASLGLGFLSIPMFVGTSSFWLNSLATFILFPITYILHIGISKIVVLDDSKKFTIVNGFERCFSKQISLCVSLVYFLSIYIICIYYGIYIINISYGFLIETLHFVLVPKFVLTIFLIGFMLFIAISKVNIVLLFIINLTIFLIILLSVFILSTIFHYRIEEITNIPSIENIAIEFRGIMPILVYSTSSAYIISFFTKSLKFKYGALAEYKAKNIILANSILVSIVLFIVHTAIALSYNHLGDTGNSVSLILYLKRIYEDNIMMQNYLIPLIIILATVTSFFANFIGAKEALNDILQRSIKTPISRQYTKELSRFILFFSILFIVALDLNILEHKNIVEHSIVFGFLFCFVLFCIDYKMNIFESMKAFASVVMGFYFFTIVLLIY